MAVKFNFNYGTCGASQNNCLDRFGCPPGVCPDFTIRRHDTMPSLRVKVDECDGPLNIQGLVVEVNMWAKGKLKTALTTESTYFELADGIGFDQIMIGDIVVMDRVRGPEYMLVTAFDEDNKLIQVDRGYRSTTISNWKKGTGLRIFRIMNAPGQTEVIFEDIQNIDGTVEEDVLTEAYLVYDWKPEDTCLPGCYWLEFKVLKMKDLVLFLPGGNWIGPVHQDDEGNYYTGSEETDSRVPLSYDSVNDRYLISSKRWTGEFHLHSGTYFTGTDQTDGSLYLNRDDIPADPDQDFEDVAADEAFTMLSAQAVSVIPSFTPPEITEDWRTYFGCMLGEGVEWERKFPLHAEGFLVKITNSPSQE